jgi:hypothetical protein
MASVENKARISYMGRRIITGENLPHKGGKSIFFPHKLLFKPALRHVERT